MPIDDRPKLRPIEVAVLLAATALGIAGARYHLWPITLRVLQPDGTEKVSYQPRVTVHVIHPDIEELYYQPGDDPALGARAVARASAVQLAAWSLAWLWVGSRIRGRAAGPSRRRPGLPVCATASVVAALYLGVHLVKAAFLGWPIKLFTNFWMRSPKAIQEDDTFASEVLADLGGIVAPAVLGALLASILFLRRRPRGWVGWVDLVLGLGWLAVGVVPRLV